MTSLARLLLRRIAAAGPITVADYMAAALGDPDHGYYTTRDPLGRTGDFVTAPEVSQMFGELLGLWCADRWLAGGRPDQLHLVELGPGRGTLMADALRALRGVPDLSPTIHVHLVETSPVLRDRQAAALAEHRADGVSLNWHADLDDVPRRPLQLLANEFFDALPVHQFENTPAGWRERMVTADPPGGLAFAAGAPIDAGALPASARNAPIGAVVETRPAAIALMHALAGRVRADGGAALVIDYGYAEPSVGDTLQAVRGHTYAPVLASPGEADVTAHVDFAALAAAVRAAGCAAHGPVPQGQFLRRLGIEARAARLAAGAAEPQRRDIAAALHRLIGSAEMGTLFRTLAVTTQDAPAPAGFA